MIEENIKPTRYQTLGFDSYNDYLCSDYWKERRVKYAEKYPSRCYVCGTTSSCQLHHKTYVNLGKEQDRDLEWLCNRHHEQIHDNGKIMLPKINKLAEMKAAWDVGLTGFKPLISIKSKNRLKKLSGKDLEKIPIKNQNNTNLCKNKIKILVEEFGYKREELVLLTPKQIKFKLEKHRSDKFRENQKIKNKSIQGRQKNTKKQNEKITWKQLGKLKSIGLDKEFLLSLTKIEATSLIDKHADEIRKHIFELECEARKRKSEIRNEIKIHNALQQEVLEDQIQKEFESRKWIKKNATEIKKSGIFVRYKLPEVELKPEWIMD